jgi:hypothetical protein
MTTTKRRRAVASIVPVLLSVATASCSSPAHKVATNLNAYDYKLARYKERCVEVTGPAWCEAAQVDLKKFKKHLLEAAEALKNGGALPLQLKAIAADARKVDHVE